jgi:hypothetical protein
MKTIVLSIMFLSYGFVFCQDKKEDRKEKREQKKAEKERYRVLVAERNNLITEIDAQVKQIVLYASYNNDFKDVYSAMFQVISSEFSSITKESESRGFIEAKADKELYRETMNAEIKGKEGAYKVSFLSKAEQRTKNKETGVISDWSNYNLSESYFIRLHTKLYNQLKGEVPLTADLLSRIESFNNDCEWVNLDLVKGRDY